MQLPFIILPYLFEIRKGRSGLYGASAVAAVPPSCYHSMSDAEMCAWILSDFAEMNLCKFTDAEK